MFKGKLFEGPASRVFDVPALEADAYKVVCTVHPNMTAELVTGR